MKKIITLVVLVIGLANVNFADEGMWIPLLLEKYNIEDMQAKGFKLSAEDIYSINQDCLMDAVVIFGRGCTGEVVSDKGLLLTNHHCGYGAIQKHSSIENDYLTEGFWAMNMREELPNENLSVKFLKSIEDVTEKVLKDVSDDLTEDVRQEIIKTNIDTLKKLSTADTHYSAVIKPFFYGNQYYMFIYEEYKDVRLVGAPPSAIGKFGGDTDNWMFPRHTGDFSIFRIYADKDNKPAEYSEENVPYKPKRFLPISVKGINEGDFTWVMGYPGSTQEYLISDAIEQIANIRNPNRIEVRDARLEVMNKYADMNDTIRIKYASKNAGASNSWKRWKGEIVGLERLKTVEKKKALEAKFQNWAKLNSKTEYYKIIPQLSELYSEIEEYAIAYDYWRESIRSIEVIRFASMFDKVIKTIKDEGSEEDLEKELKKLQSELDKFFKDYVKDIDQEIFMKLVPMYYNKVNSTYKPNVQGLNIDEISGFADNLYSESLFLNQSKCNSLVQDFNKETIKVVENDPVYKFYKSFADIYKNEVKPKYDSLNYETKRLYRAYLKGLQEMNSDKIYYPDANFTMRVSYGNVEGFSPRDGVDYKYYTTIDGVIEKDNPQIYDYDVPQKLKDIYKAKDFGIYQQDGSVPVCFIATNHTTGGNSGSPVLDAEGNLIGLNFDRAWDGIMSDMMFDPERSRNVTLDIRYLLFIVDKFAGAGHLVDEMKIIK
ncbi:MAG: S46 family peptidase [Bacteroidales bacterium]|nr:S46 family peptidase [Bacteroidales bacterium]